MNIFFEPVNIIQWNSFEKDSGIGHVESFLAAESMQVGDLVLLYVGSQNKNHLSGIFSFGTIVKGPYISGDNPEDYCNEKITCEIRIDCICYDAPIISRSDAARFINQFRTVHIINEKYYDWILAIINCSSLSDNDNTVTESGATIPSEVVPLPNERRQYDTTSYHRMQLESLLKELAQRYPEGAVLPTTLWRLCRDNPDLPIDSAKAWVKTVFNKTLAAFLREQKILGGKQTLKRQEDNDSFSNGHDDRNRSFMPASGTVSIETKDSTQHVKKANNNSRNVSSEGFIPLKTFPPEYIDNCVKRDTNSFEKYIESSGLRYNLSDAYVFFRSLYMREVSEYLKNKYSLSYAENLIIHGLIPSRPVEYWEEELLSYLKTHFNECSGGMLFDSEASYLYDPFRKKCKISAPLFNGVSRVTNLQVEEKYCGNLSIAPCFCEENYSCDVALMSKSNRIGLLNQTLFRGRGLGVYLAPLLYAGITTSTLKTTNDDLPQVSFELQFK